VNAPVFLLAATPLGTAAGAWSASMAVRLRDPDAPAIRARLECIRCGGADTLRGTVRRLAGAPCSLCGGKPPTWVLRAQVCGAVVPALALYVAHEPAAAAVVTLLGWLLLAIWVCDEMSLWIPHALWAAGMVVGLAALGYANGASAAASRVIETAGLVAALGVAAAAARLPCSRRSTTSLERTS